METKKRFVDKVAKLIFLEFKSESIPKVFGVEVKENLFLPIRPLRVMDKVKAGEKFENIPISFFIEGMVYVLGGDESFKYNDTYLELLNGVKNDAVEYIKGIVFDEVKGGFYEEAYIIILGLLKLEATKENYEKAIMLIEELRKLDKVFDEEEISLLNQAESIENFYKPLLNKAIIYYEQKKYDEAWYNINTYLEKGKDTSVEVLELKNTLFNIRNYEKGKALVYEKPKEALQYLIPLLDQFENDAILNFHIAVANRVLGNFEKAIYYLNDAVVIDSSIVEVINELGINYASLNDFDSAVKYLRKAFEATRSIEICTNLVMCYLNKGDLENAKLHYDIAKKINPKDDIVLELAKVF